MAKLLNRKYGSRIECLYYIIQSLYAKYGTSELFSNNDLKYDPCDTNNVHKYCSLLQNGLIGSYCRYLDNPLSLVGCYATQAKDSDSTKSKAVGDTCGSLEALGFVERESPHKYKISTAGKSWAKSTFGTKEWEILALNGVLSYGVVIGFLDKIADEEDFTLTSRLNLSYPDTVEYITIPENDTQDEHVVCLSTGSTSDSNTRTVSHVVAWCLSVGLVTLEKATLNASCALNHLRYRDVINAKILSLRKIKISKLGYNKIRKEKLYVSNPLSYENLHKAVRCIRENNSELVRRSTMEYLPLILGRRFVFVYCLNKCSIANKTLNFDTFCTIMSKYSKYFFTNGSCVKDIMSSESAIASIAGIPFASNGSTLTPRTTINQDVLISDAPKPIISLAETIYRELIELS